MNSDSNENHAHFLWVMKFENLITPLKCIPYLLLLKLCFSQPSQLTLSLLLSIFGLFKDSSTKQDLYSVLNLSAASVQQYKVPDKQLGVITEI